MRMTVDNGGGLVPLQKQELFQAQWFPRSRGVHHVKVIVLPEGRVEYGEYLVRRDTMHFNHSRFGVTDAELARLRGALDVLREHSAPDVSLASEEPIRRSIGLWAGDESRLYSLSRRRRGGAALARAEAFEAVWQAMIDAVVARRERDFIVDNPAKT